MLRWIVFPLLTFVVGLGLGAYGFRLYLSAQELTPLSAEGNPDAYQAFLDMYVDEGSEDGIPRVAYRQAAADGVDLAPYLVYLQTIDPSSLSAEAALAYWLNLYNAGMIQLVLDAGNWGSVFADQGRYFLAQHFNVAGQHLSLDQIENQIIRVQWDDPRIHYGLNCASLSYPNLLTTEFTAQNLDTLLEGAAHAYVNHPRGVQGVRGNRVIVSEIYEWFKEDFGGNDQGIIDHLKLYAEPELLDQLEGIRRIRTQPYDWSLNIAP